jgi:outer membrane cobalamin receptor
VLALLSWACEARLGAQATLEEEEAAFKEFLQVINTPVVSASQMLQTARKAPAKVLTITGQEIRARGYTDIEQILHDFGGFDFEKGMGVHWSQIYMRGERSTNSDRFLFIWDGVIQNDIWAQVTWMEKQFPLSSIERIEIMYGPASLLWGTNAISGIINVITRKPGAMAGFEVSTWAAPDRTRIVEFNAGQDRGAWRWRLNSRILRSDERDLSDEYWVDNAGRQRFYGPQFPRDFDLTALAANGNYDPATGGLRVMKNGRWEPFDNRYGRESQQWFVQAGLGIGAFNIQALSWFRQQSQDAWYVPQIRLKETWNPGAQAVQITYDANLGPRWESRTAAQMRTTGIDPSSEGLTFTRDKPFSTTDPTLPRITSLGPYVFFKIHSQEYRVSELLSYKNAPVSGVIGAELTFARTYEGYNTRLQDSQPWKYTRQHSDRNLAIYGNAQLEVAGGVTAALGTRFDRNWEVGGTGGFGNLFTSRMALIFDLTEEQTLKLIAGQAFQDPQPFKKYSTVPDIRPLPSPDLRPEKLNSFEVLYEVYSRGRWKTTTSVYLNRVENKIDLYPVPGLPGASQFQNRGTLDIFGGEFEGRYFLDPLRSVFLNLTANSSKDHDTGRSAGAIAPLQGNLGADFALSRGFTSSVRVHVVPSRKTERWDSTSLLAVNEVDGYVTADVSLIWRRPLPGLDLRLSVFNVGNVRYFDPGPRSADGSTYNGAILQLPFQASFGVSYQF